MYVVGIGIASYGEFQCKPTTYVTENKETIFKLTLKPNHYTTNCLYMDDSYISKFEFMN